MTKQGKKFNPIKKIADRRKRTVVKNKRRNGLLKKAVELSLLCEQQIYLVIYDPEQDRMIQFLSDPNYDIEKVYQKLKQLQKQKTKLSLRTYTNDDFIKDLRLDGSDQDSDDQGVNDNEQILSQLQQLQNRAGLLQQVDAPKLFSQMDIVDKLNKKDHLSEPFMAQNVANSEYRIFGANSQMTMVEQRPQTLKERYEEKQRALLPQKHITEFNAAGLQNQSSVNPQFNNRLNDKNSLKICFDIDSEKDIKGNLNKRNFQNMQQSQIECGIDEQYDLLQQKVRKTLGINMGLSDMKNLYQPQQSLPPQPVIQQLQQNNQIFSTGINHVNIPNMTQQLKNHNMNGQTLQDQLQSNIVAQTVSRSLKINQKTAIGSHAIKNQNLNSQSDDPTNIPNMSLVLKSSAVANHQNLTKSIMPQFMNNMVAESQTPKCNTNLMDSYSRERKIEKAECESVLTLNESDGGKNYQRLMDQINQNLMRNANHNFTNTTHVNSKVTSDQPNCNQGFTDAVNYVNEPMQNQQAYNQLLGRVTNGLVQDNNMTLQSESQYSSNIPSNNEKIQALKSIIMQHQQQQKIQQLVSMPNIAPPRQNTVLSSPEFNCEVSSTESIKQKGSVLTKPQQQKHYRSDARQTSLLMHSMSNERRQEQFDSIQQMYFNQKIANAANNELTVGSNATSSMNYTIERQIEQQNGVDSFAAMKQSSIKHDLMTQINRKKMLRNIRSISTQMNSTKTLQTYSCNKSYEMGPSQLEKQAETMQTIAPTYAQINQQLPQNYMNLESQLQFMNNGKKPVTYSQFRPAVNMQDEISHDNQQQIRQ